VGRPNTPANVRVASQYFVERESRSFNSYDGGWLDRQSGLIFDEIGSDPLFDRDPKGKVDAFVQLGGTNVFLRSRQTTVDESKLLATPLHVERTTKPNASRSSGRSSDRSRSDSILLRGDGTPSLRAAARRVLELGGEIRRAEHGETIVVSLPERLLPPSENGFEAILEGGLRHEAARCAEVLSYAAPTVLAAFESKKPLDEALPDSAPMPASFDQMSWEQKMAARQTRRVEQRRAAAAERRRLAQLNAIGATSIDEERQLFPSRYPQRLD
jgi:hypothetical protein